MRLDDGIRWILRALWMQKARSTLTIIGFAIGIAAMVLLMAGGLQWFVRTLPCPVDVDLAEKCSQTRRWTLSLYTVSVVMYAVGGYFAFFAV